MAFFAIINIFKIIYYIYGKINQYKYTYIIQKKCFWYLFCITSLFFQYFLFLLEIVNA